jgi:hypothetical protein
VALSSSRVWSAAAGLSVTIPEAKALDLAPDVLPVLNRVGECNRVTTFKMSPQLFVAQGSSVDVLHAPSLWYQV